MKRTLIVTDLTRFKNNEIVCTAGIDRDTGDCIRPMPYLKSAKCKELNILPGAILSGDFTALPGLSGPHQEDCNYSHLTFHGPCTSEEFKRVLELSCFPSVEDGFEIAFSENQKVIPGDHSVQRSIITIAVAPPGVEILEDTFNPGKIKLHFRDQSGRMFRYISITDLGFHDYALQHHQRNELQELNSWLHSQDEVFLRIGLSRNFKAPDGRQGCWLQANGIYTFPDYHEEIRSYSP